MPKPQAKRSDSNKDSPSRGVVHHQRPMTLHHALIKDQKMQGGRVPYSRSLVIGNEWEGVEVEACRMLRRRWRCSH